MKALHALLRSSSTDCDFDLRFASSCESRENLTSEAEAVNIHQPSHLNRVAKTAAPFLSKLLMREPLAKGLRLLDIYLGILQGKGCGGGWDMVSEADVAMRFLPAGDAVIFDVGANRGHWSREIRGRRNGKRTVIFQFEPSGVCLEVLRSQQDGETRVIGAAVGEAVGTVSFFIPDPSVDPGSTISSIYRQRDTSAPQVSYLEESVPMTTIDETVREHAVERVDFMKMDVEGNELGVLRGARKSLEAGKIRALAFEFGSPQINARVFFHDFWDFLRPLGFQFGRICPGSGFLPVTEYYEDLEYFRGATNYVAHLPADVRRTS